MANWKSRVGRVRGVGILEGISFLLLMGIAMPLKYMAGMPQAVTYTGWAHGVLFIAYCGVIFLAWSEGSLPFRKALMAFVASLVPFGPFIIDKRLELDEEREERTDSVA